MKKIKSHSILFKIFTVTSVLLLISTVLIYVIVIFIMPYYYTSYKKAALNSNSDKLTAELQKVSLQESEGILRDFAEKNNCTVDVSDNSSDHSAFDSQLSGVSFSLSGKQIFSDENTKNGTTSESITYMFGKNEKTVDVQKTLHFKDDSTAYYLYVNATLQPVSEASSVLIRLLPLVLVIILIIAAAGAFLYAKIISKPLIKLNKTAQEMAAMNFDAKCEVKSRDELGRLALSLNEMSENLKNAMKELTLRNSKLKTDIDRERDIERRRREFMATISHELKTPLTVLKGQTEGMIHNIGIFRDRDQYLKHSLEVIDRMEDLVKEILDISRMESSSFQPNMEDISLSEIVNACVEEFSFLAQNKKIEVIPCVEPDIRIEADRKLISKAVANIIGNAVAHSPKGAVITVNLEGRKEKAVLSVENSGAHIDESDLSKVFDAFYRVDKSRSRNTGGSGLGLYIVKMILDLHQADYCMENTSSGVKFTAVFQPTDS